MQKIGIWMFIIIVFAAAAHAFGAGTKNIHKVPPSFMAYDQGLASTSRDPHKQGVLAYRTSESLSSAESDKLEKELDKLREEMKRLEKEFKEKFEKEILPRVRREIEKLRKQLKEFRFDEKDSGPLKTDKRQI